MQVLTAKMPFGSQNCLLPADTPNTATTAPRNAGEKAGWRLEQLFFSCGRCDLVDFVRKNKNFPPREPLEVKNGGSMAFNTNNILIVGTIACVRAYNGA